MIQDCVEIVTRSMDVDKLLFDNYILADGTYVIVKYQNQEFTITSVTPIKLDKKERKIAIQGTTEYERLCKLDYYSRLIEMNKPVDSKKQVHSNNYLSFFIKKETLTSGKLTQSIIDGYYEAILHPEKKYGKNKKDMELFQMSQTQVPNIPVEKVSLVKQWILGNIFALPFPVEGKDYLKFFFIFDSEEEVITEGKRYLIPNIYNSNSYNINNAEQIYGLPNNNLGMNAKKPYLEHKTRKVRVPILKTVDEVLNQKKFYDLLINYAAQGLYNIYFDMEHKKVIPLTNKELPSSDLYGCYLRISKGKNEAQIDDMKIVEGYKTDLMTSCTFTDYLDLDSEECAGIGYGSIGKIQDMRQVINDVFFSNYLINNFFTDAKDISINDTVLKLSLLSSRDVLFEWFYLGERQSIGGILDKVSLDLVENSISQGYFKKVKHQFNLRMSLLEYFNRKRIGVNTMMEIREELRKKMNSSEESYIHTDQEYYYAVGQLVNYFISLDKTHKKTHSLANPFFTAKNNDVIKQMLHGLFLKYDYAIGIHRAKFNRLYSMMCHYIPTTKVDTDYIIAGYISNSLIYEKSEKNNNESMEVDYE